MCGQGGCPVLVACPGCDRLAAICDEDHSAFFNPRQLFAEGNDPRPISARTRWSVPEVTQLHLTKTLELVELVVRAGLRIEEEAAGIDDPNYLPEPPCSTDPYYGTDGVLV